MDTQEMMMMGLYMLALITMSWVVGEHYQEERKIYEDRLVEYETLPEDENGYDNFAQENDSTEENVFAEDIGEREPIQRNLSR